MLSSLLTLAALLLSSTPLWASDHQGKPPRAMNYFPDGGDIVCINGTNRYTRALYGSHTRMRLETSDRPVFATYDRDNSVNISFLIDDGHTLLPLDSTSFCEARYQGGQRTYTVGHHSWGDGTAQITALATYTEEGALWRFHTEGFSFRPVFHAVIRSVANKKMTRDGDYGLELRSSFEAAGLSLQTLTWTNDSDTYILLTPERQLIVDTLGEERYIREQAIREEITSRLKIQTPDPYINTLGANLAAAADGLWDGQTWLHGCVGWRTPLAGWRGAYVGDVLGWTDRARSHFDAYARSMVTQVPPVFPHPSQDSLRNLARAFLIWIIVALVLSVIAFILMKIFGVNLSSVMESIQNVIPL